MNLLHMTMKRITSAPVKLIRLALTTSVTIIKFIIKKLQKQNYKKITKKSQDLLAFTRFSMQQFILTLSFWRLFSMTWFQARRYHIF